MVAVHSLMEAMINLVLHFNFDFGADDDWTFEVWFYTTTVGSGWDYK